MILQKYILEILKNWKNPIWCRNLFLRRIIFPILFNNKGIHVLEEQWDNLIILDACRYDVLKEEFIKGKMRGKLEYRISRGADTTTFLLENFGDNKCDDIVYVTANPFVDRLLKDKFYKIISVWKYGWSEKYHTVLPEIMYEYTLYAMSKYPNKRLIIHFIQPHYPYIGYSITDGSFEELRKSTLQNASLNLSIKREYKDTLFSIYSMDIYAMVDKNTHFKMYKKPQISHALCQKVSRHFTREDRCHC